jgi:hypothetical protein
MDSEASDDAERFALHAKIFASDERAITSLYE